MTVLEPGLGQQLRYVAARFFLGDVPAGEMIRTIELTMESGLWCAEFADILDAEPIFRQVAGPFAACLDALGMTVTSHEEAVRVLVDHHTRAIAQGQGSWLDHLFCHDLGRLDFSLSWDRRLLAANDAVVLRELHEEAATLSFEASEPSNTHDTVRESCRTKILKESLRWQDANAAAQGETRRSS